MKIGFFNRFQFYFFFSSFLLSFFSFSTLSAQTTSDTLFTKYESVYFGLTYYTRADRYEFEYFHEDTIFPENPTMKHMVDLNASAAAGLQIKTKYMSFFFGIKPLTDVMNQGALLNGDWKIPVKKNIGYTLYLKRMTLAAYFTRTYGALYNDYQLPTINGLEEHYRLMESFVQKKIQIGSTFYFNKDFSFSKANSLLYFPRKTLKTFTLSANFNSSNWTNNDQAFLPGYGYYDPNRTTDTMYQFYEWDHAKEMKLFLIDLTPGFEVFFTKNTFKRKKSKFAVFYNVFVKAGPLFVNTDLKAVDTQYDKNGFSTGLSTSFRVKMGINYKNFYTEIFSFSAFHIYHLDDMKYTNMMANINLTIGYRVKSKKLYSKIDDLIEKTKKLF